MLTGKHSTKAARMGLDGREASRPKPNIGGVDKCPDCHKPKGEHLKVELTTHPQSGEQQMLLVEGDEICTCNEC